MQSVCVFCGSSFGDKPIYRELAERLGRTLANRGLTLVYGGGNVGLMGVVADAALDAGGRVIGVIPQALVDWEVAHNGLTELVVVQSMHERKARMAEASDAFIALPGGYGTFEEFCEVLTWSQLGLHRKPCGVLNVEGYYDPLLALFERAVQDRFLAAEQRDLVLADTDVNALLDRVASYQPVEIMKRFDRLRVGSVKT
ncbi:MAG TPA: TIGR00730 family Rossman fold protein [Vicinamibacterales bacterium]|nr:TIGR00730 family Rossman fold protein [Vicinamibacterales bacterium]